MKNIVLFLSLITFSYSFSQSLPVDFEGDIATSDFVDFDGGTATVIDNPFISGINTSASVARIIRDGGLPFAGSKIPLAENLDFSKLTKITMKVYTTAPVGTIAKLKLEGSGPSVEVDALTTISGAWETLEWIFAGTPNNLNEVVFMFDFGNIGDGTDGSTFYFDDVEQVAGPPAPSLISLPVDFEAGIVSSDFLNFAGAETSVIPNPQMNGINTSEMVGQIIREGGEFFAGSRILLTGNLDFSTMQSISMKVYTTAPVGTRIKLELDGSNGNTSLDYITTLSGEWETAHWNFDRVTGNYDKVNFLFDFGNVGDGSASSTFLFDDMQQFVGPSIPDPIAAALPIDFEQSVVTTDFTDVFGAVASIIDNPQIDSDNPSATVAQFLRSGGQPWAQSKLILTDFLDFSDISSISMKVYTEAPVGTLLKFKVESTETGAANERDILTTVSGAWETYSWDFAGDPPVYNVLTFMLGYATSNDASANATFLFDDIEQVDSTLSNDLDFGANIEGLRGFPNPAKDLCTITSENEVIRSISLFDILGNQVSEVKPNSLETTMNLNHLSNGIYIAQISTISGVGVLKIIVE